ncbi:MAG TPA: glutamine synthetase beta-grasp domain-containing protein, partial [Candidatus Ruania gallistercoris]|nr:glutamine synthetase beta-grasp domain-containing protein [Candidatus Ruania gallistercoris]
MFSSAEEAIAFTKEQDVKFVDVRFCDLPGVMQHFNIPVEAFTGEAFTEGLMFDGSSIRGFQAIHESDMKLVPDVTSAFVDPFRKEKTLVVNFSIVDPFTDEPYSRDPRNIAAKAEAYLTSTGIADTVFFGAEAEFYIFDDVRFATSAASSFYFINSNEAAWNTGRDEDGGNRGYKTRYKGGYFPVSPNDQMADLRDEMVTVMQAAGLEVERAHHEVGTAGQQEINYRFNTLRSAADDLMKFKYIIKNVAWNAGKSATFMPKPIFGDNGSGMHSHQSLWSGG